MTFEHMDIDFTWISIKVPFNSRPTQNMQNVPLVFSRIIATAAVYIHLKFDIQLNWFWQYF